MSRTRGKLTPRRNKRKGRRVKKEKKKFVLLMIIIIKKELDEKNIKIIKIKKAGGDTFPLAPAVNPSHPTDGSGLDFLRRVRNA